MSYGNSIAAVEAPRDVRAIEGVIEHARRLREQSHFLASKLHDMRRRLLGESDPQAPGDNSKVKEVVSEIVDLRQTLDATDRNLADIGRYIEALERV